jgi:hypothetical protein
LAADDLACDGDTLDLPSLDLDDEIRIDDVGGTHELALPLEEIVEREQEQSDDDPDGKMTEIDHESLSVHWRLPARLKRASIPK